MEREVKPSAETRRGAAGPVDVPPEWNRVTAAIIGAAMEVHTILGPGLIERLYEEAMIHELTLRGLSVGRQVAIRLAYKGVPLGDQFIDLLVNGLVVVELKAVEAVSDTHLAQLVSYLRSARIPLGLLINFNVLHLRQGIYRRVYSLNTPLPEVFHDTAFPPRTSATPAPSAFS